MLISFVQQSDSVIHTYTFLLIFLSITVYHRTWNIVPHTILRTLWLIQNTFFSEKNQALF